MPPVDCVSEADIRAYVLGDLPERVARLVHAHVEHCPICEATARRVDDAIDPVVCGLRRAVGSPTSAGLTSAPGPGDTAPEAPSAPPEPLPAPPGFEIIGELGRGGSSVVYEARQRHPDRVVALKVIVAAAHADAARKARWLAEADAIARLRHPNILQVYEVGENAGLPYLALEFCRGGSLADRLAETPLPPRAAGELVMTLARAVHAAHVAGVIHRDLKPANVLIADANAGESSAVQSAIRVADFGLAKQADLSLTATRDVLGTPSYMAPEQAEGAKTVGPAADVYALGAILYECLTGRPPFRATTALETLELVRSRDPVPPGDLQPRVPHDLETICLACLQKSPARRFASAEALADDLGRFLAGEPIRARPVRSWERAWKWARRHPGPTVAAAVGLVALATVIAIVIAFNLRLKNERDAADIQRDRAEGSYRLARTAMERGITAVRDDPRLKRGELDDIRRTMIRAEADFYTDFVRLRADDPKFEGERAEAFYRLGQVTSALGSKADAVGHYRTAADINRRLADGDPSDSRRRGLQGAALRQIGIQLHALARTEEARVVFREAEELYGRLIVDHPEVPAYTYDYVSLLNTRIMTDRAVGDFSAAEAGLRRADELLTPLLKARPDYHVYIYRLACIHGDRAVLYGRTKRRADEEIETREALRLIHRAVELDPTNDEYRMIEGHGHTNLAVLYRVTNRTPQSVTELRQAEQIFEDLTRTRPSVTQYRELAANCQRRLGITYRGLKDTDQAAECFRRGVVGLEALTREQPGVVRYAVDLGNAAMHWGAMLNEVGRPAEALVPVEQAVRVLDEACRQDPTNQDGRVWLYWSLWERGLALKALRRFADAEPDYSRAIQLCTEKSKLGQLCMQRAEVRSHLGDHEGTLADADAAARDNKDGSNFRFLAYLCARVAATARANVALPPAERTAWCDRCSERAVRLLAAAKAAGQFPNPEALRKLAAEEEFAILRERSDFLTLVAEPQTSR
jgi:tetratricopeptide (TPR) repeat protein